MGRQTQTDADARGTGPGIFMIKKGATIDEFFIRAASKIFFFRFTMHPYTILSFMSYIL